MKKIIFFNILVVLMIISIFIPNFSYTATTFKEGDSIKIKAGSQLYEAKQEQGQKRLAVKKVTVSGKNGIYKSKVGQGTLDIPSTYGVRDTDLSYIMINGNKYLVKTNNIEKSSESGGTSSISSNTTGGGASSSSGKTSTGGSSSSSSSTEFKSGDKVQAKQAAQLYIRKQVQGQARYDVEKATAQLRAGKVVTYKSKVTPGTLNISVAFEVQASELSLITVDNQEYLVKTSLLEKANATSEDSDAVMDYDENGSQTSINDANEEEDDTIFHQPNKVTSGDTSEENLDDLITDAESFIKNGDGEEVIDTGSLQNFSRTLYNILLAVGVVAAVIVGALLGIKLMTASVEEKAEVQKMLIPYVVGCVVIFGGFTIWKIVVEILSNL